MTEANDKLNLGNAIASNQDTLFSAEEWLRYSRQLQLPGFGANGQQQLKNSHVMIIGMGGLGAPAALYLAAAGVGQLTLVDGDSVELSNLQRQVLFTQQDVNQPKVICAQQRLQALNPTIKIHTVAKALSATNQTKLFAQHAAQTNSVDLILDCTDNLPSRYLINDLALLHRIAWVYASVHQYSGQSALFAPNGPCYRCVFPASSENSALADCNSAGVIGVLPGLLGLVQASTAIRFLAGLDQNTQTHLLQLDTANFSTKSFKLTTDASCRCRSASHTIKPYEYQVPNPISGENATALSTTEFNQIRNQANVEIIDVRSAAEYEAFHIGGRLIPLDELESLQAQLSKLLSKEKHYLCYCQTGKRSQAASELLQSQGFKASNLEGGLYNWLKNTVKP